MGKLKAEKKPEMVPVNFKCTKAEKAAMEAKARKFTQDGNLSLWLRHAGTEHTPKKKHLD